MGMYDIWGSRSGSKHTQELGKALGCFFMIKYNGRQRMKEVNKALDTSNMTEWHQQQKSQSNETDTTEDYKNIPLKAWEMKHVSNWVKEEGMEDVLLALTKEIKNGIQLKELNKEKIKTRRWTEETKRKLIYKCNILHRIRSLDLITTNKPIVLLDD